MLNLTYFLANFDRKDQREKKIIRCVAVFFSFFFFGKTLPIYSINEKKKKKENKCINIYTYKCFN